MSWGEEWPRHRARLMASTMQPIDRQIHDEQSWRELNDYLSELNDHNDELKCDFPDNHECGPATHRYVSCKFQFNICDVVAANRRDYMSKERARCQDCWVRCADCWRVWPI
jgi:hypothetical protein